MAVASDLSVALTESEAAFTLAWTKPSMPGGAMPISMVPSRSSPWFLKNQTLAKTVYFLLTPSTFMPVLNSSIMRSSCPPGGAGKVFDTLKVGFGYDAKSGKDHHSVLKDCDQQNGRLFHEKMEGALDNSAAEKEPEILSPTCAFVAGSRNAWGAHL
jgi:hypothetical protein